MPQRRVLAIGSSCEVLGRLLRRLVEQGHEVESAFDGRAALDLLSQWQPDLILLAPPLENLDVPAFLAEQRRHGHTGAMLTVELGADDALEVVGMYGDLGVDQAMLTLDGLLSERQILEAASVAESAPSALDLVPDAIVVSDNADRIVFVNRQTEALLGYRRQELLGQPVHILVPESLRQQQLTPRARYLAAPGDRPMSVSLELTARHADGSELPVDIRLNTLETEDGLRVVGAIRDVTDRREVERLRGESISLIAHELRNAVTLIRGYAQFLQLGGTSSSRATDTIVRQTERLERLLDDLTSVAGRGAEQLPLQCDEVDLVALVQSSASQAQDLSRSHTVRVEAPAQPVVGRWDAGRLEQVLHNLFTNAVKYSPNGGEILARVEALDEEARVSVIDHGLGIAPEARPHVFERSFRAQEARVSGVPGRGLGLHIVRTLVEAHGGLVILDSGLGPGTTVVVTLPYQREPSTVTTGRSTDVPSAPPTSRGAARREHRRRCSTRDHLRGEGRSSQVTRELLDSITQTIFAVGLSLDSCRLKLRESPDHVEARLSEAAADLNQILTEIRVYALDLDHRAGWQANLRQAGRSGQSLGRT